MEHLGWSPEGPMISGRIKDCNSYWRFDVSETLNIQLAPSRFPKSFHSSAIGACFQSWCDQNWTSPPFPVHIEEQWRPFLSFHGICSRSALWRPWQRACSFLIRLGSSAKPSGEPFTVNSFLLKVIGRKFMSLDVAQIKMLQKLHSSASFLLKSLVNVWL